MDDQERDVGTTLAGHRFLTLTFAVIGICSIVTGIALRPAGAAGRPILAAGVVVVRRSRSYRKAVTNAPGGAFGAGVTVRS